MKKIAILFVVSVFVFAFCSTAFAGTIKPGQKTSCKDANSITLESSGTSSAGDRANANAVIWKSSNFTTVPISIGPGEHNGMNGARGVGMANKEVVGVNKVTLTKQENFSRGDSIGDISGEVRITNTGTIPINVTCG